MILQRVGKFKMVANLLKTRRTYYLIDAIGNVGKGP